MSLKDMANEMDERSKINARLSQNIGSMINEPKYSPTAADLLTDISKKVGFDPNAESCDFRGSRDNQAVVRDAIIEKYGEEVANDYEPAINVKPKTKWLQEGYIIKDGEIALCFVHTYRDGRQWTVPLYHQNQMELAL